MKKGVYSIVIAITVYLVIMYEWPAGITVLSVELAFLPLCLLLAVWQGRNVKVSVTAGRELAEKQEEVPFLIEVRNRSPLPAAVKVRLICGYAGEKETKKYTVRVNVGGGKTVPKEWKVSAEKCGRMQVKLRKYKATDCLGFFAVRRKGGQMCSVTVMPKPYPVNLVVSGRTKWFPIDGETYAQDRSGEDSAEIYEVREYRPGDRQQKVHWKLSAKAEELYIKEFSYPIGAAVILLLEGGQSAGGSEFLEAVVSLSMAMLAKECPHYLMWKQRTDACIQRRLIRSEEDFYEILQELLALEIGNLERDMEERYRYEYRSETYATMIKLSVALVLQVDHTVSMDMKPYGIERFFEETELVV